MPTLYLHIGMPKTGTTFIQKFMGGNSEIINRHGYIYPRLNVTFEGIGINRNAHFMVCNVCDENGKVNKELKKQIFEDSFLQIGELFKEYDNIVLSDESLWNSAEKNYYNKNLWADLKKKSEEMNFDIKIIVYLRRQDLFVQSFWAQQVKETYTNTFENFIKGKIHARLKLDYYSRLCEISQYIGKENIFVRVYEKSQYQGTDNTLISDFLHTIGLELTDEWIKPEREFLNGSLSGVYLETKRVMNDFDEFKVKMGWFSHLLQRTIDKNQDLKSFNENMYFKSADSLKEYIGLYSESNSKVAKEFLGREDGCLFTENIVDDKFVTPPKYSDKDVYRVLADALALQNEENELLKEEVKTLTSTVNWISAPIHVKVIRKLKRIFIKPSDTKVENQKYKVR